ncbi:MAG: TonB-dependent receptor [Bryobacteraceae bacterium]
MKRNLQAIFVCLAGALCCFAQPQAHLAGVIADASSGSVPDAIVSVVNEDLGFRRVARSQADGRYSVPSLQPGVYKIMVRKEGFRTSIRFGVKLDSSQAVRADFALVVGSVHEVITVEGTAPLLNTEDASVSTTIGRDEVDRIPVNQGGLLNILELAPGTIVTPATRGESGQFTANGQRPNTHYFTVDGVSANTGVSGGGSPAQSTGGALPGMSAIGSMHSFISTEAMEEVRVLTSTTASELGRMPGAQVSIGSRSGSNDFHGTLAYFFRHEDLAANDWFANASGAGSGPLRLNNFAATLGGPAIRNHTFFFVAYEGMRLRQPSAWSAPVPSAEFRRAAAPWAQPALGAFPMPNGVDLGRGLAQWTGRNNRPSGLHVGSARIDQVISSRVTAFARYNQSPSESEFGNAQINRLELESRSATLGISWRPTPASLVDTRFNFSGASALSSWRQADPAASPCALQAVTLHFISTSNVCSSIARFTIAGVGQLVSGPEGFRRQGQFQYFQSASIDGRTHSLRAGVDFRRLTPSRQDAAPGVLIIADTFEDFVAGRNISTATSPAQNRTAVTKELSLFAQDTWRISPRLTATFGLRWELSLPPSANEPAYFLDAGETTAEARQQHLWPLRYGYLAPRLGIAYRPFGGRTVVRGGFGIYYDSSLSLATDLLNGGPFNVTEFYNSRYAPLGKLSLTFGFPSDLRLPQVKQWNAAVEHAFSDKDVASVSYVGSNGADLVRREIGGRGTTDRLWLALSTNNGNSAYHALQIQYRRSLSHNLQGRVSYAWSHSIDNGSSDSALQWVGAGTWGDNNRGSSDFDVRHSVNATLSYEIPRTAATPRPLRGFAIDGMFRARSGFPINVLDSEQFQGVSFANVFRPNLVTGMPSWIEDAHSPAGRRVNPDAFRPVSGAAQGNLGRNSLTGFGLSQVDLSVRREFSLGETRSLQLRVEAFNAFNHPYFADPEKYLISPLFGQPTSMLNVMLGTGTPASGLAPIFQAGGARSLQLSLRFRF